MGFLNQSIFMKIKFGKSCGAFLMKAIFVVAKILNQRGIPRFLTRSEISNKNRSEIFNTFRDFRHVPRFRIKTIPRFLTYSETSNMFRDFQHVFASLRREDCKRG